MKSVLVAPPIDEVFSLEEIKAHLRVDHDAEDDLIGIYQAAARRYIEDRCWIALMPQTWDVFLDRWPWGRSLELPKPPLMSVAYVKYIDASGNEETWPEVSYSIDAGLPGRIVLNPGQSWPSVELHPVNPIAIRIDVGFADAASVPEALRQALLLLVGHFYANREAAVVVAGMVAIQTPLAVDSLLALYEMR